MFANVIEMKMKRQLKHSKPYEAVNWDSRGRQSREYFVAIKKRNKKREINIQPVAAKAF